MFIFRHYFRQLPISTYCDLFQFRENPTTFMKKYLWLAAVASLGLVVGVAARGFSDGKGLTKGTA